MPARCHWIVAVALGCAGAVALAAQAAGLNELVATLNGRYNSMTSWQADFTQLISDPSGLVRHASGHLFLSKPGKMRWDYQQPVPRIFLVDGKVVWQYTLGGDEAARSDLKTSDDLRTPLRFLLGHTALEKELEALALGGLPPLHPADYVLHGKPQPGEEGNWSEVWIEASPAFEIDRLVIALPDGSRNDIRFDQIKPNVPLTPSLFKFTPPPGVRVVASAAPGGGA